MPIDASRNPYDAPRFDGGAGKAVRPDEVAKEELDDELDSALDDLGAKGAVSSDDLAAGEAADPAGDDLDLAGTGAKGALVLDDDLTGADVKSLAGGAAGLGDEEPFEAFKGDDAELVDAADLGAAKVGAFGLDDDLDDDLDGGGAFAADLGEVPDLDDKGDLGFDDDEVLIEDKGSIVDAIADVMKQGVDDV